MIVSLISGCLFGFCLADIVRGRPILPRWLAFLLGWVSGAIILIRILMIM